MDMGDNDCTFMAQLACYLPADLLLSPSTISNRSTPLLSLERALVTSSPPHLPQAHSGNVVASCLDCESVVYLSV